MKALDIAFDCPPADWWQRRRAEGYRVVFQDVWTGGFANNDALRAVAPVNLRNARAAGIYVAGYACASPPDWWPVATQMMHIERNAGDQWPVIDEVMLDVEIPGVTQVRVKELADALNAAGKRTDILYTARWFWLGHMGNTTDAWWRRFRLLSAHYDWNPDIDFGAAPYGPWSLADVIGEQYAGSVKVDGYDIDLIELVDDFLEEEVSMATLDQEDRAYLAGMMRGLVRALATGQEWTSGLRGDPDYPRPEHSLAEVLAKTALTEAQVEAIVLRILKRQKLVIE